MTDAQRDASTAQRHEKCNPFLKERHQFVHKAKKKLRVSNEALSGATPAPHTYTDIETTATSEREREREVGSTSSSPN